MPKARKASLSKYKIFETEQFRSDIEKLPKKIRTTIENKIRMYMYPQLGNEPNCGLNIKKLKNYTPPTWRYRIGNYRIFYGIDEAESLVSILTIDLRKDAY
jgi:mRNA interferase RelE/StbE